MQGLEVFGWGEIQTVTKLSCSPTISTRPATSVRVRVMGYGLWVRLLGSVRPGLSVSVMTL